MEIAKQVKILREAQRLYGNNINCDEVINKIIGNKYICPACNGEGVIRTKYDAYPAGLPDSGWAHDWQFKDVKCSLCNGEGFTDKKYVPKMVQDGWTTEN